MDLAWDSKTDLDFNFKSDNTGCCSTSKQKYCAKIRVKCIDILFHTLSRSFSVNISLWNGIACLSVVIKGHDGCQFTSSCLLYIQLPGRVARRLIQEPEVPGSIPGPATYFSFFFR